MTSSDKAFGRCAPGCADHGPKPGLDRGPSARPLTLTPRSPRQEPDDLPLMTPRRSRLQPCEQIAVLGNLDGTSTSSREGPRKCAGKPVADVDGRQPAGKATDRLPGHRPARAEDALSGLSASSYSQGKQSNRGARLRGGHPSRHAPQCSPRRSESPAPPVPSQFSSADTQIRIAVGHRPVNRRPAPRVSAPGRQPGDPTWSGTQRDDETCMERATSRRLRRHPLT